MTVLEEACAKHDRPLAAMRSVLIDHHVRLAVVERMGYERAAAVVRNLLANSARVRSGDAGEILATEYVEEMTEYQVPIRRLRYRDDRTVPMRGDDLIGIALDATAPPRILKVESKSREVLSATVVGEAGDALARHSGRPNPSTLAFISTKLRDEGRDDLAEVFEDLQAGRLTERSVAHLIFVLSGNDPSKALEQHRVSPYPAIARALVGLVIDDHPDFIRQLYETV